MARPTCCQSFLAFLLKFLNYLQTFMAVSIVIYSAFMLNHWHNHSYVPPAPPQPQPHPPAPSPFSSFPSELYPKVQTFGDVTPFIPNLDLNLSADTDMDLLNGAQFNAHPLPAPWFIYAFMGVGIVLCCITCIGHIAAEAINGCCLCFHAILTTIFVLLEISFVAFIFIDPEWEKDIPTDSTGELDRMRSFFEENRELCELVCISVITIQVLSLLLSIILRALVNQKADLDNESAYENREKPWEPLLHPRLSDASGSIRSDNRGGIHSDIWSVWMREKYGLNGGGENEV